MADKKVKLYTKKQVILTFVVGIGLGILGIGALLAAAILRTKGYDVVLQWCVGISFFPIMIVALVWLLVRFKNIIAYETAENTKKAKQSLIKSIDVIDYETIKNNYQRLDFKRLTEKLFFKKSDGFFTQGRCDFLYFSTAKNMEECQEGFEKVLESQPVYSTYQHCYFVFFAANDDVDVTFSLKEKQPEGNFLPFMGRITTPIVKHLIYKENEKKLYYNDLRINSPTKKAIKFIEQELPKLLS